MFFQHPASNRILFSVFFVYDQVVLFAGVNDTNGFFFFQK